jgi:hypothetical protein
MANVDNPNGFRFVRSLTGGTASPIIYTGEVAASQTIAAGDALAVSSGQIIIATATSGAILGVATEAVTVASGATGTIHYVPALSHYVFEGQCSGTFAQSIMYSTVDIEGTTGIMEVNENATTEQVLTIIDLLRTPLNTIGANSRVEFVWTRSAFMGMLAALT